MVRMLNVIGGIILVIGLMGGIIIGLMLNWLLAIGFMASSTISGILMFAFAYMIDLLEENNFYLRHLYYKVRDEEKKQAAPTFTVSRGNSRSSLDKMQGYTFKGID